MVCQRIKTFWIDKINNLITTHNIQPDEVDWQDKINAVTVWDNFEIVGLRVCRNIYTKANQVVPADNDIKGNGYGRMCGNSFKDLVLEYEELVEVMKIKIGADPTDPTLATDPNGNNILVNGDTIPKWKHDINQKIYNNKGKLTDIPAGTDLTDLLYCHELYLKIIDNANGLPKLISWNLVASNKPNAWGCDWSYGVNNAELQNYKNASGNLTTRENEIKHALNWNSVLPNWQNIIRKVNDYCANNLKIIDFNNLPIIPTGEDLASLLIKSAEYTRIHTKLNGKISDSELQALIDAIPTCPHTDYDTIKSERDNLKTENTQLKEHQCDCASKIAAKETEIITKIITDLSLSTERERERENLLEAVITEIKGKLTPPTDNPADSSKDNKITELETEITKLKAGKPQNEVVEKITEFSKQLNLSESQISELKKADSYQSLFAAQSKMVESKLNSEVQEKNHAQTLNYVLGAISLGSLLILAWILVKRTKFIPEIGSEEKKE